MRSKVKQQYDQLVEILTEFFKDPNKAKVWMHAKNPLLGNQYPVNLLNIGRFHKLLTFVKNNLSENVLEKEWEKLNIKKKIDIVENEYLQENSNEKTYRDNGPKRIRQNNTRKESRRDR